MARKLAKETVKIDQYGRVLIPSKLGDKLGLKQGSSLEVRVRGDELLHYFLLDFSEYGLLYSSTLSVKLFL